jgi:surface antigen
VKTSLIQRTSIVILALGLNGLTGCTKEMGAALGSAAGSIGSSYLPVAAIPVGGAVEMMGEQVGGLVGEQIARYLDEAERKQAEKAALDALNSRTTGAGSTQTWTSKTNSGVSGGSTIVAEDKANDGRVCRTQRNFINVRGKDIEQTDRLCRDPKSGAWIQA